MSDQEQLVQPAEEKLEGPPTNVGFGSSGGQQQGVGATEPSRPTMPVVHQPHYVPLQQVPQPRSLQEQLAAFNFDQASWSVFHSLEAQHGVGSRAVNLVHGGLTNVIATAGNARPESLESLEDKYRKLIGGILLSGERTGSHYFDFSRVEFQHILDSKQGVTAQPKPPMTAGRLYLTNQRLLLLSAGNAAGIQLTNNANTGALPNTGAMSTCKTFSVTGSKTSTCRYENIPLADIRGVDMSSVFSGTSSMNVKGIIPQQSCLSWCCPEEEKWDESPLISSTNLVGVINMGALIPPWQTKCNVLIFLPQNSQTASIVEFIRALQYAAPAFQSNPGN